MGIQGFISSKLNQKAVYWGNPKEDGYGGKTWDDPVEIRCRWQDMQQTILEANGEVGLSRAVVFTEVDMEENGLILLGELDELLDSSGQSTGEINLSDLENVWLIKRWEKTPALNDTTNFLRKAYLTPFLT